VPSDGTYSFAITSSDPDGSGFHSRESSVAQPILEVVAGPHPTPPVDAGRSPPVLDAGTEAPGWSDAASEPPKLLDAGAQPEAPPLEAAGSEQGSCAIGPAPGAPPSSAPFACVALLALRRSARLSAGTGRCNSARSS